LRDILGDNGGVALCDSADVVLFTRARKIYDKNFFVGRLNFSGRIGSFFGRGRFFISVAASKIILAASVASGNSALPAKRYLR